MNPGAALLLDICPAQEKMVGSSQKRAIRNSRSRLSERGLARFEVLGRDMDRDLIRSLARRLAEDGPEAARLRAVVSQSIAGEPSGKGGILAALRRSPLVGVDLDFARPFRQAPPCSSAECTHRAIKTRCIQSRYFAGRPQEPGFAQFLNTVQAPPYLRTSAQTSSASARVCLAMRAV